MIRILTRKTLLNLLPCQPTTSAPATFYRRVTHCLPIQVLYKQYHPTSTEMKQTLSAFQIFFWIGQLEIEVGLGLLSLRDTQLCYLFNLVEQCHFFYCLIGLYFTTVKEQSKRQLHIFQTNRSSFNLHCCLIDHMGLSMLQYRERSKPENYPLKGKGLS